MKINILSFNILIPFIIAPYISNADHITAEGNISGEWNADTVMVTGDITIPDGENLIIAPGTVVEFMGSFTMFVEGSVTAAGLQNDSIFFQVADTTGFSVDTIPDGGWQGIKFDHNRNSNDSSLFVHCRFSFGKNSLSDPASGNGGVINVQAFNKIRIDHCLFTDNFALFNGGAVALDSASIIIENSAFTHNRCGKAVAPWGYGGAISSDNSSPEIRWNVFEGNSSTGVGGGISVRYEDCNIYNNLFKGNYSALGGALAILHMDEVSHRINNNLIEGNASAFFGGGVANLNASPIYINNTIVYNSSTYGGGFYCKDSVSPDFYNTIFWGNTAAVGPQGYLFEFYSQADFFNCDVEGGPGLFGGSGGGEAFFGAFEQCLDTLPGFSGNGEYPFALMNTSACIDMGSSDTTGFFLPETDLAGAPRVFGANIDMGAYEWFWVGTGEEKLAEDRVKIWPNPCVDHIYVEVDLKEPGSVIIEVFDIMGRRVTDYQSFSEAKGEQQFTISVNDISEGMVMVKISIGKQVYPWKLYKISHR
jgi:hypothetical protein